MPLVGSAFLKLYWKCRVLLGPQDKRNVGKQKRIQQSAGKILRGWTIYCITEGGNCLVKAEDEEAEGGFNTSFT